MKFLNHPYQVFVNQIKSEVEIAKIFLEEGRIDEFKTSLVKIIAFCQIILFLNREYCFEKIFFSKMKKIITLELQNLIDDCPTDRKNSQEIYFILQSLFNSWLKGNMERWDYIYILV